MTRNDRAIVGLTMIAHAMVHTYELSIPIFMTIWLTEFGLSKAALGAIVAVGYGLFGLGALPGGLLSDWMGSKRLIIGGLLGMGGAFVLLGLAHSVVTLTLALLMWGAAASVYHPAGLALISKGVQQRGRAFAFHGMAGNIGIALGPLMTTVLLLFFEWRTVSMLLACPAAVALVAGRLGVDETAALSADERKSARVQKQTSFDTFWADTRRLLVPSFLAVIGIVMLSGLYYRGALTFLPDLLGDVAALKTFSLGTLTLETGRYIYSGLLIVGILGQYVGGRLTDRIPTERGLAGAFSALALIALLFLPAAKAGLVPLLGISAVLGFCLFVVQPLYQATVAEYTPADARGLSYGYTYLAVFGVGALGAALTGAILEYFSPAVLFGVLACFAGGAALLGVRLTRRQVVAHQ